MKQLTHLDAHGRAQMVDISPKQPCPRQAEVMCRVLLSPGAFDALVGNQLEKGNALNIAELAGMQAAKRASDLIPLCHPLSIDHFEVVAQPVDADCAVHIRCRARTTAKTGIEMEAFTGAAVAALSIYDMVKAINPGAVVTDLRLISKLGGAQNFPETVRCEQQ